MTESGPGKPQQRTVRLEDGPADGREVLTAYDWVHVSILDGELLVLDTDDPATAVQLLNRVERGQWAKYELAEVVEGRPDVFQYAQLSEEYQRLVYPPVAEILAWPSAARLWRTGGRE